MGKLVLDNLINIQNSNTALNSKALKRKRIINFRAFLSIALFLLCTVFSAVLTTVYAWMGIVLFALIMSFAVFLMIFYRKNKLKRWSFIVCAVCCALSFASFLITNGTWIKDIDYSKQISVVGTVESDITVDGIRKIYLKNISLNGEGAAGRILLYVKNDVESDGDSTKTISEDSGKLESGAIISLSCRIFPENLTSGLSADGSAFRDNRRYTATIADSDIIKIGSRNPGLFIKIREFIKDKLVKGLGDEYGALSYGMITGDKSYLTLSTRNYFSASGLVHILSVSGLHLGFLTAFLTVVLKKAKAARAVTAAIILSVLIFYAFIAGFSPSVLRAAIMSAVGLLMYLFGRRGDTLNTLSFAFCVIITFMPFYLFEAGFILSFSCVFGIALFYPLFYKGLRKIKFPKFIAAAVAVSAAIQIGFIPAVIFLFNNVQPYGFIVNIFLLPIISLCFMLTFICLIFTSIIPPAVFVFKPTFWGFKFLDFVAYNVAKLPLARVAVYSLPVIFVIYILYFLCSRYFMVRRKWIVWIVTLIFSVGLIVVQNPATISNTAITPLYNGYSPLTYITENADGYLVGDIWSGYLALNRLKSLRVRRLAAIFVLKMDSETAYQIQVINGFFTDFTLYYPDYYYEFYNETPDTQENSFDEDGYLKEKAAINVQLKNIKTVPFKAGGVDGAEIDGIETITLSESFSAIFADGEFAAYGFCPNTGGAKTNILLPKAYFKYDKWYARPQITDSYNIVCSHYYRPLGINPDAKLYLINGDVEGYNVYSAYKRPFSYNYLSFKFDYDIGFNW